MAAIKSSPRSASRRPPVIDRQAGAHGTIYVVAMSKDSAANYHQRLHALDVTTGAELLSGPTEIQATFGASSFSPGQYEERAALLLSGGTIYTSWTSHCDIGPYGGWILAFNQSTLAMTATLNVAMGASGSGFASQGPAIWMSGGGPAADSAGNIYLLTANGRFETTLDGGGFSERGRLRKFVSQTFALGNHPIRRGLLRHVRRGRRVGQRHRSRFRRHSCSCPI